MMDDVVRVLRRDTIPYHYIPTSYFGTYYREDFHAIFWEVETKREATEIQQAPNGSQGGKVNTCEYILLYQPEYGGEQADAGRDCRTRLARPHSQVRTRTGKYLFPLFS